LGRASPQREAREGFHPKREDLHPTSRLERRTDEGDDAIRPVPPFRGAPLRTGAGRANAVSASMGVMHGGAAARSSSHGPGKRSGRWGHLGQSRSGRSLTPRGASGATGPRPCRRRLRKRAPPRRGRLGNRLGERPTQPGRAHAAREAFSRRAPHGAAALSMTSGLASIRIPSPLGLLSGDDETLLAHTGNLGQPPANAGLTYPRTLRLDGRHGCPPVACSAWRFFILRGRPPISGSSSEAHPICDRG